MEKVKQVYQSLSHSKWDCKYHVVFIPQKQQKPLFGQVRRLKGCILKINICEKNSLLFLPPIFFCEKKLHLPETFRKKKPRLLFIPKKL